MKVVGLVWKICVSLKRNIIFWKLEREREREREWEWVNLLENYIFSYEGIIVFSERKVDNGS